MDLLFVSSGGNKLLADAYVIGLDFARKYSPFYDEEYCDAVPSIHYSLL
jgi:hypothetical protein